MFTANPLKNSADSQQQFIVDQNVTSHAVATLSGHSGVVWPGRNNRAFCRHLLNS